MITTANQSVFSQFHIQALVLVNNSIAKLAYVKTS